MTSSELTEQSEHPEAGEQIIPGVKKYHVDPTTLPNLPEGHPIRTSQGEPAVAHVTHYSFDEWDVFIKDVIGGQEKLGERREREEQENMVVDYRAGDIFGIHADFDKLCRQKSVVVSVEGEGNMFFPPEEEPCKLIPGDVIVIDGMVNPDHWVEALTDRRAVVINYEY